MHKNIIIALSWFILAYGCALSSWFTPDNDNGSCRIKDTYRQLFDSAYSAIELYGIDTILALSDTCFSIEDFSSLQVFASENHAIYYNRVLYLRNGKWKSVLYSLRIYNSNPSQHLSKYFTTHTFSSCDSAKTNAKLTELLFGRKSPNDTMKSMFSTIRITAYAHGKRIDQNWLDIYSCPLHNSIYPLARSCKLTAIETRNFKSDVRRLKKRRKTF